MKSRRVAWLLVSVLFVAAIATAQGPRARPDVEQRVEALLARMTLDEKLGQLQMLDGMSTGEERPEHAAMIRAGKLGSTLNVRGARRTNQLQRIAMEESRLRIPVLFAFDVIHGYRTVFPVPLAEASSWDPAAVERAAGIAADEASAVGLKWTFAPMVDIARDARWGRIIEGSGEDPYLGAAMARARVRGFQGDDYSASNKVIACAKHWVGYGAAEGGRDYNTTDISEGVLRDVYFPPFKAAVDAGVGTVMSAFNDLNGVPASANPWTLTAVLRKEWGFDGVVVSDYTSVKELINHGLAADEPDAARLALAAGVDVEMVSTLYNASGPQLVRDGKLTMGQIDDAVRRVLRIKFRAGLFDHPYVDEAREGRALLGAQNVAAARSISARSCVLLKNDKGVLPLNKSVHSIAVIGPLADSRADVLGSWSGDGRPEDAVTPLEGIRSALPKSTTTIYSRGCDVSGGTGEGIADAVRAAKSADAAVVVVGESADMSGEASSRSSLDLPGLQLDLVKAVIATGTPTVVVLLNGRPLTIGWLADNAPAILEAWYGGSQAGNAIADVLFGDVNPGGKLPVTFPRSVGQLPLYYNHKNTGRPPSASDKYTSKYLDVPVTPVYPFGYGLSYTTFELANLKLSATKVPKSGAVLVSVEVTNTGTRSGDEVVQLYVRDAAASVTRAVRELKGFQRVTLRPGEKRRVEFTLGPSELGFHDRSMEYVVEPGVFNVFVGTSSVGGLESRFEVVP